MFPVLYIQGVQFRDKAFVCVPDQRLGNAFGSVLDIGQRYLKKLPVPGWVLIPLP